MSTTEARKNELIAGLFYLSHAAYLLETAPRDEDGLATNLETVARIDRMISIANGISYGTHDLPKDRASMNMLLETLQELPRLPPSSLN